MKSAIKYASVPGKLVMVGFGCIGQATLPLLFRHLELEPQHFRVAFVADDVLRVQGGWKQESEKETAHRRNFCACSNGCQQPN